MGDLDDLTLEGLYGVGETSGITGVLEEGSDGGLTGVKVVEVRLGAGLLLDKILLLGVDSLSSSDGSGDGLEVEHLSLGPVEHVNERVLHLVTSGNELILEDGVAGVVEDEAGGGHVDVGGEVNFLVDVPHAGEVLVVVNSQLLGGEELRKFVLEILEVGLDLLHEVVEVIQVLGESFLLGEVVHGVVDFHGGFASLVKLASREKSHVLEALLDVHASLGTRETLELGGLNDELEAGELAHELLQVETTFLDEDHILVANSLLWGNGRNWDTRPSLGDSSVEFMEVTISTGTIPFTKTVVTSTLVHDGSALLLGVLYGVAHGVTSIFSS